MEKDCCAKDSLEKKDKGILKGILYGIFPHSFCIGFVIFSAIGAVVVTGTLKKIMMTPYFLQILFLFSIIMATISATIYLKKCNCLNKEGARKKWKYLTILFGTTILINFLMFSYVLPVLANMGSSSLKTNGIGSSEISVEVDIPCAGHAPLVIDELKEYKGVEGIRFYSPDIFKIVYDSAQISSDKIMATEIFKTYKARITQ